MVGRWLSIVIHLTLAILSVVLVSVEATGPVVVIVGFIWAVYGIIRFMICIGA